MEKKTMSTLKFLWYNQRPHSMKKRDYDSFEKKNPLTVTFYVEILAFGT